MGKSSGNTGTAPFDNSRSYEHKPHLAGPPGMTQETQMILRAAPDALGAAGPAEHDADAPSLNETEEKLSAPASQKHSNDREATEETLASKKHANDMSEEKKKEKAATEKPSVGEKTEKSPPASAKLTPAASKKKKTSASKKPTRKMKMTTASPKPAPKKPAVKKPAAKQPSKTDAPKEDRRTSQLPPKRTDVLSPGPYEGAASDTSDTDTPNPALVTGDASPVGDAPRLLERKHRRQVLRPPQPPRLRPRQIEARRRTRRSG
ncbi:unnamed protein product [Phytophthora fragariaefolia]|uniref:Unnamed protein product n=1 Tax=Phytophthora fragariaefolia TaxID=1490495 RepID=A0A9W6YE99_9STRA|nr:unnamed protein product [Phytophthora fragariaefolia]